MRAKSLPITIITMLLFCMIALLPAQAQAKTYRSDKYITIAKGNNKKITIKSCTVKKVVSSDTSVVTVKSLNTDNAPTKNVITINGKAIGSAYLTVTKANGNKYKIYVSVANSAAAKFLNKVADVSDFCQDYPKKITYGNSDIKGSLASAKSAVKDGDKITMNCATPAKWGLKYLDLVSSNFYTNTSGTVYGLNSDANDYLNKITSGSAIGLTVKKAAEKGLLQPGDIIGNSTFTHTFIYYGMNSSGNPLVYEAGGNVRDKGDGMSQFGCGPFTSSQYKGTASTNIKIKVILRWKKNASFSDADKELTDSQLTDIGSMEDD